MNDIDLTHPGFRYPVRRTRKFPYLTYVAILFAASVVCYLVVPHILKAAGMPEDDAEKAHKVVEEYEGQTRKLCAEILNNHE